MKDKLFDAIRSGSEEEAHETFNNLHETAVRGAVMAIMARNNSHSIGKHVR